MPHPLADILARMQVGVVLLGEPTVRARHLQRARGMRQAEDAIRIERQAIRHPADFTVPAQDGAASWEPSRGAGAGASV